MTAPIELLGFIVATPTRGPFKAWIGDTIGRNGHDLGMHYPTDHWRDSHGSSLLPQSSQQQTRPNLTFPNPGEAGEDGREVQDLAFLPAVPPYPPKPLRGGICRQQFATENKDL